MMKPAAAALLSLGRGQAPEHIFSWDELVPLAERHQVAPLLYWNASESESVRRALEGAPAGVQARLRIAWLHHTLRNEHLAANLVELDRALEAQGVTGIVLKGPWLAYAAYPHPGTRTIDDIDLCIREQDYVRARKAIESLGYAAAEELPSSMQGAMDRAQLRGQLRFAARGRRQLELHFRMVNVGIPGRDEGWLWERTRSLPLPGGSIRVPGPEAMLLHLALHANQHGFAALRLFYDLRFFLDREGGTLDRDVFLGLVRSHRCGASVYHALSLARELAAAPVDEDLLESLRPSRLRRRIFSVLWDLRSVRSLERPLRSPRVEAPRLYLLEMDGPLARTRYLVALARGSGTSRRR